MPESFELADGYIRLKADTTDFDKSLGEQKKKLEEFNKQLKPTALDRSFQKLYQVPKELDKTFRNIGVMLDKNARALERFRERIMGPATAGMALAGGAVGLAATAGPMAANTLTGSVQLLSATIGQDFIPLLVEFSFTLQKVAKWWEKLDDKVKDNVVSTVRLIGVASAAAVGLSGVTKALTLISRHPLVMAAGLLAGIALNDAISQKPSQSESTDSLRKQIAHDAKMDELRLYKPEVAKEKALEDVDAKRNTLNIWKKDLEEFNQSGVLTKFGSKMNDALFGTSRESHFTEKVTEAQRELDKAMLRAEKVGAISVVGKKSGEVGEGVKIGSGGPASFSAPGDLLKSIMQAAATAGSLEGSLAQKHFEASLKTLEAAEKTAANTEKIANQPGAISK